MLIFLVDISCPKTKEANYQLVSLFKGSYCTTYGNRTRDSSVKGRRLNPLTNAADIYKNKNLVFSVPFDARLFMVIISK